LELGSRGTTDFSQGAVYFIGNVAAWELDKLRPIASTAEAVAKLTALGFKHGWLPMRLRRNQ